jgi:hypothetical protein
LAEEMETDDDHQRLIASIAAPERMNKEPYRAVSRIRTLPLGRRCGNWARRAGMRIAGLQIR